MADRDGGPDEGTRSTTQGPERADSSIPAGVLELDHVFEALAHSRRRYLLYTLQEETEWSLTELAAKVAAWENDATVADVDEAARERVYVSLYHTHVPKLAEERILRFDEDRGTIAPGEYADQVLAALAGAGASLDAGQESHAREDQR